MKALKNFDAKQFLLQRGGQIGLGAAVAIMALMLTCGLFWPGNGLFGPSASANADDLKKKNDTASNFLRNNRPGEQELEKLTKPDPKLMAQAKFKPEDADDFRVYNNPLYLGEKLDDRKRRSPTVKTPVEFRWAVARPQIRSHIFSKKGDAPSILVLKGGNAAAGGTAAGPMGPGGGEDNVRKFFSNSSRQRGGAGGMMPPMMGGGGMYGAAGGGPMGPGGGGGPMGPGGGGGPMGPGGGGMMPGMMRPGGGRGMMPPGMGLGSEEGGTGQPAQQEWRKLDELEKGRDAGRLAVDILPMRMVVVTGSFPFKDQLEEFRRALRFDSIDDLFRDRNSTPTFLTPEVQRCEYHKGPKGEWVQGRWQKL